MGIFLERNSLSLVAEFGLDDGEGERNRGSTSHQLSSMMIPVGILKTCAVRQAVPVGILQISAVRQANHVYFDCSSSFF